MQNFVHRRCKGYGRHSKWRCCAHKASRTRGCKYPIWHEPLQDKKLNNEEENYQLADVIKIVNAMLNSPEKSHGFHELSVELGDNGHLLYHSEVWWISRERVMECGICKRNFFCDLINKIMKLFFFTICFVLLD